MAVLTEPPGLPLWSDYRRFIHRHLAVICALMVVGTVAGFAWSMSRPAQYSATASVVLSPVPMYVIPSTSEIVPPEVSIDTDAQLLDSPEVRGAIADALDIDAADASDHLTVTASANSHVLHVTLSAASPEAAAAAADAAAEALAQVRRQSLGTLRDDQLRQLRLLISHQQELVSQGRAQGTTIPAYDEASIEILDLNNALRELEEARDQPAEVVTSPAIPTQQDHPNTEVYLVSGAMVGLLCGCLLGAARDRSAELAPAADPDSTRHPIGDLSNSITHRKDHHHVS
jgi:uncharacterized protein involved in exopolysaccharide biosynthesis